MTRWEYFSEPIDHDAQSEQFDPAEFFKRQRLIRDAQRRAGRRQWQVNELSDSGAEPLTVDIEVAG